MEYNTRMRGPQPPRMPRGHPSHPPRMMNNMFSYQQKRDDPHQQSQLDYGPTYPTYPPVDQSQYHQFTQVQPPCFMSSSGQMYFEPPSVYMSPATPPVTTATIIPAKNIHYNSREQLLICSNCMHRNALLESEFFKTDNKISSLSQAIKDKDNTIAILTQENNALKERIGELQDDLNKVNSLVTKVGEIGSAKPIEASVVCKASELSPDAKDFIPKEAEPIDHNTVTNTIASATCDDVPVVSAKGVTDEPTVESQAEDHQLEEFVKTDPDSPSETMDEPPIEESHEMLENPMSEETSHPSELPLETTEVEMIKLDVSSNLTKPEVAAGERQENVDESVSKNPEPDTNTQGDTKVNRTGSRHPCGELRNDSAQTQRRNNQKKRSHDNNAQKQLIGRGRGAPRHFQENVNDKNTNYPGKYANDKGNYSSNLSMNQNNRNNQYVTHGGTNSHDGRNSPLDTNLPKDNKESFHRDSSGNRGGRGWETKSNGRDCNRSRPEDVTIPRSENSSGIPHTHNDSSRRSRQDSSGSKFQDQKHFEKDDTSYHNNGSRRGEQSRQSGRDRNRLYPEDSNGSRRENSTGTTRPHDDISRRSNQNLSGPRFQDQKPYEKNDGGYNNNRNKYLKNIVQEVRGDLFSAPQEASLAHCVAKDFRMGSGIAVKFKNEFKRVSELMDQNVDVGGCAYLKDKDRYIFYMVTKAVSNGKPSYETVEKSLKAMRDLCCKFEVTKLAMPHIACGLDKLDWNKVRRIINEVFHEAEIQITVYDFNVEGLSEAEGNKPTQTGVYVKHTVMDLVTIAAQTALLFLGTEDGHLDSAATNLNNKFNFVNDYKKSKKIVGKTYRNELSNDYYIYSLIIAKTAKDKILFTNVEECCKDFSKWLRKDEFEFVGLEVAVEWSGDTTFTEKIVTLLRNSLPRSVKQLWVCYRDPKDDVHDMHGRQTSTPKQSTSQNQ
uniref:Macro domain-containing protein n=1 Tax=Cuerna arida TaxID=1464854 RepID=A0A1B6GF14_9HEMI